VDDDFAMLWLVLLLMMKVLREGVVGLLQLIVVSFYSTGFETYHLNDWMLGEMSGLE